MLIEQEDYLRAGLFFAVLIGMACWEVYAPKRKLMITKWLRWQNNLALTIINSILLKIWLPVTATEVAAYAAGNQWGLFNQLPWLPAWLVIMMSIVLLDLAVYGQHVAFHFLLLFGDYIAPIMLLLIWMSRLVCVFIRLKYCFRCCSNWPSLP